MGYRTNKFDHEREVEQGGWVVAWSHDISETDVAAGIVAVGISVFSAHTPNLRHVVQKYRIL